MATLTRTTTGWVERTLWVQLDGTINRECWDGDCGRLWRFAPEDRSIEGNFTEVEVELPCIHRPEQDLADFDRRRTAILTCGGVRSCLLPEFAEDLFYAIERDEEHLR